MNFNLRRVLQNFRRQRSTHLFFSSPLSISFRRLCTVANKHVTVDPTEIQKLFRYTTDRWLYNEREQNSCRYVKFDVDSLLDIACKAVGARSCTAVAKLSEGSYNKAFLLTFDNETQVIARIPCPIAGPSYLTTASEVATLEFAREVLQLPVPRILTWSGAEKGSTNCVGVDYIIMEAVPGVPLGMRWNQVAGREQVSPLVDGLLDFESRMESVRFSQYGSLYFKEDVAPQLQTHSLFAGEVDDSMKYFAEKYRIGPLIDHHWWRGVRSRMAFDWGPWPDATSYYLAAAKNEQKLLAQHTPLPHSQTPSFRRTPIHPRETHLRLLDMYIRAIPFVIPQDSELSAPTLWHPDLSLGNILISESHIPSIQGVIDWQHAAVLPYFQQVALPPAITYEGHQFNPHLHPLALASSREPPDTLDSAKKEEFRLHHRLATRHNLYQAEIRLGHKRRHAASSLPHIEQLIMLPAYVVRACSDGILDLRQCLLFLRDNWIKVAPAGVPCPIEFSQDEIVEHERQWRAFQFYQAAIELFNTKLGCEGDGKVSHESYAAVKERLEGLKESWSEEFTGSPFPYQNGEYSYFLS
ncbi:kinase-like domain-containing protein [Suillus subalutaceus]|uniref:kinase-like domain-containing protein n=1 Tax=Suillus subalutaceus TaxID=48586 RepID=UPI001B865E0D|nr:kinase-like domain-containing protein [Suillus subalutaceus]KAG1851844.1 kinase-like domain-containing protein [Suillus subalutaceus]